MAQFHRSQQGVGGRPGQPDEGVDGRRGQGVEQQPVYDLRGGLLGVHVQVTQVPGRHHVDRVNDRAQRAQRVQDLIGLGLAAQVDGVDHDERAAAYRLADLRDGGEGISRAVVVNSSATRCRSASARPAAPPERPGSATTAARHIS